MGSEEGSENLVQLGKLNGQHDTPYDRGIQSALIGIHHAGSGRHNNQFGGVISCHSGI